MKTSHRFFFHYNKPESLRRGHCILTVHWKSGINAKCMLVTGIVCNVPVETKINKEQPRCVMQGFASNIEIKGGTAFIS